MSVRKYYIFILCLIFFASDIFAQSESVEILEEEAAIPSIIQETESSVNFEIPSDILNNLFAKPGSIKKPGASTQKNQKKNTGTPGVRKLQGFRIQVFSDGRNPATLEARAKARGNAIAARFPKYRGQIYTFSSAPNWYTRIGNFETNREASLALDELKRAFPSFAGEMRIVKSQITVIK